MENEGAFEVKEPPSREANSLVDSLDEDGDSDGFIPETSPSISTTVITQSTTNMSLDRSENTESSNNNNNNNNNKSSDSKMDTFTDPESVSQLSNNGTTSSNKNSHSENIPNHTTPSGNKSVVKGVVSVAGGRGGVKAKRSVKVQSNSHGPPLHTRDWQGPIPSKSSQYSWSGESSNVQYSSKQENILEYFHTEKPTGKLSGRLSDPPKRSHLVMPRISTAEAKVNVATIQNTHHNNNNEKDLVFNNEFLAKLAVDDAQRASHYAYDVYLTAKSEVLGESVQPTLAGEIVTSLPSSQSAPSPLSPAPSHSPSSLPPHTGFHTPVYKHYGGPAVRAQAREQLASRQQPISSRPSPSPPQRNPYVSAPLLSHPQIHRSNGLHPLTTHHTSMTVPVPRPPAAAAVAPVHSLASPHSTAYVPHHLSHKSRATAMITQQQQQQVQASDSNIVSPPQVQSTVLDPIHLDGAYPPVGPIDYINPNPQLVREIYTLLTDPTCTLLIPHIQKILDMEDAIYVYNKTVQLGNNVLAILTLLNKARRCFTSLKELSYATLAAYTAPGPIRQQFYEYLVSNFPIIRKICSCDISRGDVDMIFEYGQGGAQTLQLFVSSVVNNQMNRRWHSLFTLCQSVFFFQQNVQSVYVYECCNYMNENIRARMGYEKNIQSEEMIYVMEQTRAGNSMLDLLKEIVTSNINVQHIPNNNNSNTNVSSPYPHLTTLVCILKSLWRKQRHIDYIHRNIPIYKYYIKQLLTYPICKLVTRIQHLIYDLKYIDMYVDQMDKHLFIDPHMPNTSKNHNNNNDINNNTSTAGINSAFAANPNTDTDNGTGSSGDITIYNHADSTITTITNNQRTTVNTQIQNTTMHSSNSNSEEYEAHIYTEGVNAIQQWLYSPDCTLFHSTINNTYSGVSQSLSTNDNNSNADSPVQVSDSDIQNLLSVCNNNPYILAIYLHFLQQHLYTYTHINTLLYDIQQLYTQSHQHRKDLLHFLSSQVCSLWGPRLTITAAHINRLYYDTRTCIYTLFYLHILNRLGYIYGDITSLCTDLEMIHRVYMSAYDESKVRDNNSNTNNNTSINGIQVLYPDADSLDLYIYSTSIKNYLYTYLNSPTCSLLQNPAPIPMSDVYNIFVYSGIHMYIPIILQHMSIHGLSYKNTHDLIVGLQSVYQQFLRAKENVYGLLTSVECTLLPHTHAIRDYSPHNLQVGVQLSELDLFYIFQMGMSIQHTETYIKYLQTMNYSYNKLQDLLYAIHNCHVAYSHTLPHLQSYVNKNNLVYNPNHIAYNIPATTTYENARVLYFTCTPYLNAFAVAQSVYDKNPKYKYGSIEELAKAMQAESQTYIQSHHADPSITTNSDLANKNNNLSLSFTSYTYPIINYLLHSNLLPAHLAENLYQNPYDMESVYIAGGVHSVAILQYMEEGKQGHKGSCLYQSVAELCKAIEQTSIECKKNILKLLSNPIYIHLTPIDSSRKKSYLSIEDAHDIFELGCGPYTVEYMENYEKQHNNTFHTLTDLIRAIRISHTYNRGIYKYPHSVDRSNMIEYLGNKQKCLLFEQDIHRANHTNNHLNQNKDKNSDNKTDENENNSVSVDLDPMYIDKLLQCGRTYKHTLYWCNYFNNMYMKFQSVSQLAAAVQMAMHQYEHMVLSVYEYIAMSPAGAEILQLENNTVVSLHDVDVLVLNSGTGPDSLQLLQTQIHPMCNNNSSVYTDFPTLTGAIQESYGNTQLTNNKNINLLLQYTNSISKSPILNSIPLHIYDTYLLLQQCMHNAVYSMEFLYEVYYQRVSLYTHIHHTHMHNNNNTNNPTDTPSNNIIAPNSYKSIYDIIHNIHTFIHKQKSQLYKYLQYTRICKNSNTLTHSDVDKLYMGAYTLYYIHILFRKGRTYDTIDSLMQAVRMKYVHMEPIQTSIPRFLTQQLFDHSDDISHEIIAFLQESSLLIDPHGKHQIRMDMNQIKQLTSLVKGGSSSITPDTFFVHLQWLHAHNLHNSILHDPIITGNNTITANSSLQTYMYSSINDLAKKLIDMETARVNIENTMYRYIQQYYEYIFQKNVYVHLVSQDVHRIYVQSTAGPTSISLLQLLVQRRQANIPGLSRARHIDDIISHIKQLYTGVHHQKSLHKQQLLAYMQTHAPQLFSRHIQLSHRDINHILMYTHTADYAIEVLKSLIVFNKKYGDMATLLTELEQRYNTMTQHIQKLISYMDTHHILDSTLLHTYTHSEWQSFIYGLYTDIQSLSWKTKNIQSNADGDSNNNQNRDNINKGSIVADDSALADTVISLWKTMGIPNTSTSYSRTLQDLYLITQHYIRTQLRQANLPVDNTYTHTHSFTYHNNMNNIDNSQSDMPVDVDTSQEVVLNNKNTVAIPLYAQPLPPSQERKNLPTPRQKKIVSRLETESNTDNETAKSGYNNQVNDANLDVWGDRQGRITFRSHVTPTPRSGYDLHFNDGHAPTYQSTRSHPSPPSANGTSNKSYSAFASASASASANVAVSMDRDDALDLWGPPQPQSFFRKHVVGLLHFGHDNHNSDGHHPSYQYTRAHSFAGSEDTYNINVQKTLSSPTRTVGENNIAIPINNTNTVQLDPDRQKLYSYLSNSNCVLFQRHRDAIFPLTQSIAVQLTNILIAVQQDPDLAIRYCKHYEAENQYFTSLADLYEQAILHAAEQEKSSLETVGNYLRTVGILHPDTVSTLRPFDIADIMDNCLHFIMQTLSSEETQQEHDIQVLINKVCQFMDVLKPRIFDTVFLLIHTIQSMLDRILAGENVQAVYDSVRNYNANKDSKDAEETVSEPLSTPPSEPLIIPPSEPASTPKPKPLSVTTHEAHAGAAPGTTKLKMKFGAKPSPRKPASNHKPITGHTPTPPNHSATKPQPHPHTQPTSTTKKPTQSANTSAVQTSSSEIITTSTTIPAVASPLSPFVPLSSQPKPDPAENRERHQAAASLVAKSASKALSAAETAAQARLQQQKRTSVPGSPSQNNSNEAL